MIARARALGLAVACATAASSPAAAQVLRGRAIDAESAAGLQAVDLRLLDMNGREADRITTDSAGRFALRPRRAGTYRVQAALIGYTPFTSSAIELHVGETVMVTVQLSTRAIPLEPLVITARQEARGRMAEFERRRARSGSGYFITREDIDRQHAFSATTLVQSVPGVTIDEGRTFSDRMILLSGPTGPCRANLYLDGLRITGESIDHWVQPEWIAGVEVYSRGAFAPPEYRDMNNCGTVLVWTRDYDGEGKAWSWKRLVVAVGLFAGLIFVSK